MYMESYKGVTDVVTKHVWPIPALHVTRFCARLGISPNMVTLVSFIWPAQNPELVKKLSERNINVMAMDMVPRISRAQSLDALSSMANIGGYRAVVEGSQLYGRAVPMMMTAAGTVAAATIFGVGKTFFWPTMLAITSEQFPRGGALLLNLMGGAGMLSVMVALPVVGQMMDSSDTATALRQLSLLPAILSVVFAVLWWRQRQRGGYAVQALPHD